VSEPKGRGGLRAVLYDMDGLLVDSEPLWFEVETQIMARMGGAWTHADQQQLVGGPPSHSMRYMLDRAARPVPEETVTRWMAEGITGLVRRHGVPMMPGALVTAAHRDLMEAVLETIGVAFGATVCADDVRNGKPHPEPYLLATARLGVDPGGCVALEDSPNGIASAEAAGCVVIAVPNVAPVPPRPGQVIATSLCEVDLGRLRQLAASGGHPAVTNES
jgi:beta-phosphoglucomutase-like phosphatase (HAD superfamily)